MSEYGHVTTGANRDQNRVLDPLELKLKTAMSAHVRCWELNVSSLPEKSAIATESSQYLERILIKFAACTSLLPTGTVKASPELSLTLSASLSLQCRDRQTYSAFTS